MTYFWPPRHTPKGFSIESLAKKYREKISGVSSQKSKKKPSSSLKEVYQENRFLNKDLNSENIHWANRDFSEYRRVA